jgi:hypothetical protein
MKKHLFFLFALTWFINIKAKEKPLTLWTAKNPFEQKVFIENKGQYELKNKATRDEILFGARQDGLHYYFTKNVIYIEYIASVKRTRKEIEAEIKKADLTEEGNTAEEKEFAFRNEEQFHVMEFAGAGGSTIIIPESQVGQLYNFSRDNKTNISAHAYKKITYQDLYPGIDMEFYFPEDKQGFKYNFIVHPGADLTQLKIQYPLSETIKLTPDGDIHITSVFGNFIDHAPVANESQTLKPVPCSFLLNKGSVSFNISA